MAVSGAIVLELMEVVPVPEHVVSVEQSVTKLIVAVPEMISVPAHLVIVLAEQLDVVDEAVCDGVGFCEPSGSSGTAG
jgi:hypothetical protein